MNSKTFILIGAISALSVMAADRKKLREELEFVPVPELPAKAVRIIQAAPPGDRDATANVVVREIVKKHPAAAATLVSAINKNIPEASSTAARAAVKEAPQSRQSVAAVLASAPAVGAAPGNASNPSTPVSSGNGSVNSKTAPAPSGGSRVTGNNNAAAVTPAPPAEAAPTRSEPSRDVITPNANASGRAQANPGEGPSQGRVVVKDRPVRYQRPDPPRRPVDPPVRKRGGRTE